MGQANEGEETGSLIVEVQTNPEEPALHIPWPLIFLVDHPSPGEVKVHYPPLPEALSLESIRTGSRMIEDRRWTVVEFWFIPQQPGRITLNPFELVTPDKRALTQGIALDVQGGREYPPYFSWETPPGSLKIGEKGFLSLRLSNWDPKKPLPGKDLPWEEIPEQVILEEQPLSQADREGGIILRLGVIPLEGQQFTLKAIHFFYEGLGLEIPSLSIPLIPREGGKPGGGEEMEGDILPLEAEAESPPGYSFPELPLGVFPLFRANYERGLQRAREFWNEGKIPEALVEMRRNERESPAGHYFMRLRQEAERILGFEVTQDEQWRPRKVCQGLFFGSLALLILMILFISKGRFFLAKRKSVTSSLSWGYKSIISILMVVGAVILFVSAGGIIGHNQERGVLRAAAAYRIPDAGGGVSADFKEGQPVIIRSASDSWVYVESFDGRLGWVLRDRVIVY